MFAIPCIDGKLIENEGTLARFLNNKFSSAASKDGFTVALLNDFQIPWVEKSSSKYPLYPITIKLEPTADDAPEDYGDEAPDDDDIGNLDDDDEEEKDEEDTDAEMEKEKNSEE
jgi:hypothetical protein